MVHGMVVKDMGRKGGMGSAMAHARHKLQKQGKTPTPRAIMDRSDYNINALRKLRHGISTGGITINQEQIRAHGVDRSLQHMKRVAKARNKTWR